MYIYTYIYVIKDSKKTIKCDTGHIFHAEQRSRLNVAANHSEES